MSNTKTTFAAVILCWSLLTGISHAQDISGQWSGRWHSDANQHSGNIGATFCQLDGNTMQANFRGTFAKVIPFRYRTRLNIVSQQPGLTVMSGSRRLPLGAEFRYQITLDDNCFCGSFSSRRNRGTFVMSKQ